MSSVSFPLKYSALAAVDFGAPAELITKEISGVEADQILVKAAAASINFMDTRLRKNPANPFNLSLPLILGFDFSGTIVAVGSGVKNWGIGEKVFGKTQTGSCFAQYIVLPINSRTCLAKCRDVPFRECSTYGIAYLSAYEPLLMVDDLRKRSGQSIYIAGGAGGVGHFAVQLAKLYGLTVISSGSKPESLDLLRSLGVDLILDYNKQNVVEEVLKFTNGVGVNLVYDSTYQTSSFNQSAAVIARGGHWIKLGPWNHIVDDSEAKKIVENRGGIALFGHLGRYSREPEFEVKVPELVEGLNKATEWYHQGKLKPHVITTLKFDPAALQEALDHWGKGKYGSGKTVVQISN